jgi:hypothetical protein
MWVNWEKLFRDFFSLISRWLGGQSGLSPAHRLCFTGRPEPCALRLVSCIFAPCAS